MKTLIMPNKLSKIDEFKDSAGFIVGIKNLSWYIPLEITGDELITLSSSIKKRRQKLFISLNKLMYNQDIPLLKEYLLLIEQLNIDGIMYDDIAVYNLSKSLSLKTPLVWFGTHSFTSFHTANYWYQRGVKSGLLSTEITLEHIMEIKDNTDMSLMMYGYGYLPMFVSSRPLLTSYFKHIGSNKEDKTYHMYEEARNMSYPTYETETGTIILSSEIINTINELPVINNIIDYLILSGLNIDDDKFYNIYECYTKAVANLNDKATINDMNSMVIKDSPVKTDKGFLYKETIYKVKNDGER